VCHYKLILVNPDKNVVAMNALVSQFQLLFTVIVSLGPLEGVGQFSKNG